MPAEGRWKVGGRLAELLFGEELQNLELVLAVKDMVENSREYEIENNINDKEDYNHGDGNDSRDRRFAEGDFFLPVFLIRLFRFRLSLACRLHRDSGAQPRLPPPQGQRLRLLTPPLSAPVRPIATLRSPPSWSRQAG